MSSSPFPSKRTVQRMIGHPVRIQRQSSADDSDYIDSDRNSHGSTSGKSAEESSNFSDEFFGEEEEEKFDPKKAAGTSVSAGVPLQTNLPTRSVVVKPSNFVKKEMESTSTSNRTASSHAQSAQGSSERNPSSSLSTDETVAGMAPVGIGKTVASSFKEQSRKRNISVDEDEPEDSKPLKRQKVDAQPHSKHWLSGQMVVIRVEDTAFRLLANQLEKESTFFSNLFNETGADAAVDDNGDKVFTLDDPGVTKINFSLLLDVMGDPLKYFDASPPFLELLEILLCSYRLGFSRWQKWAIREVEKYNSKLGTTYFPIQEAKIALLVFRTCGLRSYQKRMMYEIIRQKGSLDQDTVLRRPDGQCDAIVTTLYQAREKVTSFWLDVALRLDGGFWTTHRCPDRIHDCQMPSLLWQTLYQENIMKMYIYDPLFGLDTLLECSRQWEDPTKFCCMTCIDRMRREWVLKRGLFLRSLDGWFELDERNASVGGAAATGGVAARGADTATGGVAAAVGVAGGAS
ncbi:hypothetical protein D9758_006441 [Tetrapyrgos nigripes]|uniref:BTB domain-containing protein n=1 Tax=Tetrapyrgos nigripes TaxID=182062 RepID=A0A8H5GKM1_9AGAR|nr:hypothetical protein D9758_006441 [Tetrapyrgos nigripes]